MQKQNYSVQFGMDTIVYNLCIWTKRKNMLIHTNPNLRLQIILLCLHRQAKNYLQ